MSTDQAGINKAWELSLYELHRRPQPAITDETEIAVSPRSLHSELMCPICLDMLKKTMTTKECLHRFCSECIITALRSGNKECPTCRKKLVSKRSLRPDPNFDLLISKIHPSRDEYEAHQTRVLEKLNKSQSQAALVQSIHEGMKIQSQTRLQRTKKSQNDNDQIVPSGSDATSTQENSLATPSTSGVLKASAKNTQSGSANKGTVKQENDNADSGGEDSNKPSLSTEGWTGVQSNQDDVELVFKPHPSEGDKTLIKALKDSSIRYLKTTADATSKFFFSYMKLLFNQ